MPAAKKNITAASAPALLNTTAVAEQQATAPKPVKAPKPAKTAAPASAATAVSSPVAAVPQKATRRRAKSENPPPASPNTARARRSLPLSPRTTARRLNVRVSAAAAVDGAVESTAPETITLKDIRVTTNSVARNVSRLCQLSAAVARSKNGEYKCQADGKTYTTESIREMRDAIESSVRRIPTACRQASKKSAEKLSLEEKERRQAALIERAERGARELANSIGMPKLAALIASKEKDKILKRLRPPRPDAGLQISGVFLISDQFRAFVSNGNFGNGVAYFFGDECSRETRAISGAESPAAAIAAVEKDIGRDPVTEMGYPPCKTHDGKKAADGCKACEERADGVKAVQNVADPRRVMIPLIIHRGVASSPLFMSIMAAYVAANNLKDETTGRIKIDENMRKHFGDGTTTRWIYRSEDFTPADASEDVNLSALERIKRRPPKKVGDPEPLNEVGYLRSMSITIATMFRIAKTPEKHLDTIKNQRITDLANGLNCYL
jgi:hypothetical protein